MLYNTIPQHVPRCLNSQVLYCLGHSRRSGVKNRRAGCLGPYPWGRGLACGPVSQVMVHHTGGCYCGGECVLESHKGCGKCLAFGCTLQDALQHWMDTVKHSTAV